MQTFSFHVPADIKVTSDMGKYPLGDDVDFFVAADSYDDCYKLVERVVGSKFGSFLVNEINDAYLDGHNDLKLELQRTQWLTGSIKIVGAIEARNKAGFKWIYVVGVEGAKERVYFEDTAPAAPDHYKVIAKALVAQF
ncbi:hypothetical protein EV128_125149 [Rhizobium azibense]|nr:hypothetical protein EV128_125149 [Rhizobium azibense]